MNNSRRDFLKKGAVGTAVAAASGGTTGALAKVFQAKTKKIATASHVGAIIAEVRDNKIVGIESQNTDKNPNIMVKALAPRETSNSRVKYPCVRKSFLEGKGAGDLRGKEEFVRVSWDKALDLVAESIKSAQKKGGNKALYHSNFENWAEVGSFNNPGTMSGRFFNKIGGAVINQGDMSTGACSNVNAGVVGDSEVYSQQTSFQEIIKNTKVMVLWGADLYKCNRIGYSVPTHSCYDYYEEYKKAGIKFISIDPIYTQSAQEFKADWIKIRPNTDVALMLGMMHYLYKSGKYDAKFIKKYTDGFDKFLPYLLGKEDKIEKTPAWASKITTISEDTIKELANTMVSNRTFIAGNWAMQRAHHGEQVDWALITLASMIGQVGIPGGGFGFSMHYENGGDANSGKATIGGFPQGGGDKVRTAIPASRAAEMLKNPGKTITYNGNKITFPEVHFMLSAGCSPIGRQPDVNEMIEAVRGLDTYVVVDPWWTPSAKMADIVLPATTFLERDDVAYGMAYSNDRVYAMKKVIDPRYESKDDYAIFAALAKRFGKERRFTENRTPMQWIERLYNISYAKNKMGISFKQFWEKGMVKYSVPAEARKYVRHQAFREDPVKNKLQTESGKIQIYSERFAKFGYKDFKGHATWFEPAEWLGNEKLVKKFPLHMLSPHATYRVHSQFDNTWVQDAHKVQGREPMRINPKDAAKYGVKDGEIVEVYNDRGSLLAGVVVTKAIREGVIAIEEGAWYSPIDAKEGDSMFGNDQRKVRCNSGHANVLTSSRPSSQMSQATTVNTLLVAIRKVDHVSPNMAHQPPVIKGA